MLLGFVTVFIFQKRSEIEHCDIGNIKFENISKIAKYREFWTCG